jgi:hypothetical protein
MGGDLGTPRAQGVAASLADDEVLLRLMNEATGREDAIERHRSRCHRTGSTSGKRVDPEELRMKTTTGVIRGKQ